MVEKLEIGQQRRVRKNIFDEHRFTPAAMPGDQVWNDALLLQCLADLGYGQAGAHCDVIVDAVRMAVERLWDIDLVDQLLDANHRVGVVLGNEIDSVAGLVREISDDLFILARKVLMNEQEDHKSRAWSMAS